MHRPYEPRRKVVPENILKYPFCGDFEYVVTQQPQPKLCFGSTITRETLPLEGPALSSFMRRVGGQVLRNIGPGSYKTKWDAFSRVRDRKTSKRGLGPKAPRFTDKAEYQPPLREPTPPPPVKQNCAPFNSTSKRKTSGVATSYPAPCDYLPQLKKREIKFLYSFQGKKSLVCAVKINCVPYNLDECGVCGCSCSDQGDYWSYKKRLFLCRKHYNELFTHCLAKFQGAHLSNFQSVRDCFFAHAHNSCKAALKIMPMEDIVKKLRKEAYLDLYFPQRRFCNN